MCLYMLTSLIDKLPDLPRAQLKINQEIQLNPTPMLLPSAMVKVIELLFSPTQMVLFKLQSESSHYYVTQEL